MTNDYDQKQIDVFDKHFSLFKQSEVIGIITCKHCKREFCYYTHRGLHSAITKAMNHGMKYHQLESLNRVTVSNYIMFHAPRNGRKAGRQEQENGD